MYIIRIRSTSKSTNDCFQNDYICDDDSISDAIYEASLEWSKCYSSDSSMFITSINDARISFYKYCRLTFEQYSPNVTGWLVLIVNYLFRRFKRATKH